MPEQQKKKTNKRTRPQKYAAQYVRTAKNKRRARAKHEAEHPNDVAAKQRHAETPVKLSK